MAGEEGLQKSKMTAAHCFRWNMFLVCLAGATLLAGGMPAQEQARPWTPGETLTYDVHWRIFPAGEAQMQVSEATTTDGHPAWQVHGSARSTGLVAALYRVEDFFDSNFHPVALCSYGLHKRIREGRRQRDTRIRFDTARNVSLLEEHDPSKPDQPMKRDSNPIEPCTQDVVSALYFLRSLPLETGRTFEFPINDGGKTYRVHVEVQAREEVKTGLGVIPAYRVEAKVFEGLFRRKGRLFVWYSDDSRRLPIQMRAKIAWGTLTGTLARIESKP